MMDFPATFDYQRVVFSGLLSFNWRYYNPFMSNFLMRYMPHITTDRKTSACRSSELSGYKIAQQYPERPEPPDFGVYRCGMIWIYMLFVGSDSIEFYRGPISKYIGGSDSIGHK